MNLLRKSSQWKRIMYHACHVCYCDACKCLHGLGICVWFYPNKLMMMTMMHKNNHFTNKVCFHRYNWNTTTFYDNCSVIFSHNFTRRALHSLTCTDVPLRNCSLTRNILTRVLFWILLATWLLTNLQWNHCFKIVYLISEWSLFTRSIWCQDDTAVEDKTICYRLPPAQLRVGTIRKTKTYFCLLRGKSTKVKPKAPFTASGALLTN